MSEIYSWQVLLSVYRPRGRVFGAISELCIQRLVFSCREMSGDIMTGIPVGEVRIVEINCCSRLLGFANRKLKVCFMQSLCNK